MWPIFAAIANGVKMAGSKALALAGKGATAIGHGAQGLAKGATGMGAAPGRAGALGSKLGLAMKDVGKQIGGQMIGGAMQQQGNQTFDTQEQPPAMIQPIGGEVAPTMTPSVAPQPTQAQAMPLAAMRPADLEYYRRMRGI